MFYLLSVGNLYSGDVGMLMSILTVVGVIFTTYFNFKKLNDNIKSEERWRTTVEMKLASMEATISLAKHNNDELHTMVNKMAVMERDMHTAYSKIDENRNDIRKSMHCMYHDKGKKNDGN